VAVQFADDLPEEPRPLAERLRHWEGEYHYPAGLLLEAAERIEELERQLEALGLSPGTRGGYAAPQNRGPG
jgi:hypothetical protein